MKRSMGYIKFFIIILMPIFLVMLFVIALDPFFHYHAPGQILPYRLSEERYQNNGIVKHFDYEAIISGSSEAQNFKTTDFERLFGATSVKTCFAGGSFKEVDSLIKTALKSNSRVRYVVRSLDLNMLAVDKDSYAYEDYPDYLYDDNIFNDYQYLFNKEVVLQAGYRFLMAIMKQNATTFDEYGSFYQEHVFSKAAVLSTYSRANASEEKTVFTDAVKEVVLGTVNQNIIETAESYPDVTFYYFFPPYSICYWDALLRSGQYDEIFDVIECALNELLEQDNICVFSFYDCYEVVTNLDNYMDTLHYSEVISTMLLEKMANNKGLLTKENYKDHLDAIYNYYRNYDYESIYIDD